MNYRHAFHAGNFADVAKHLALVAALAHLKKKEAPFLAIDSHAGRGVYDLTGDAATRTGEAVAGIDRLRGAAGGNEAMRAYLDLAADPKAYPGSPLLIAKLMRPQDRLVAIDKHPEDAAALAAALHPFRRAKVEQADGYARLPALLPPPERRGLVLIDPPYEAASEFSDIAGLFAAAHRRFATGLYLLWFPIKSPAEADGFCGEVLAAGPAKALRFDIRRRSVPEGRLGAAGLLVINPPWQFQEQIQDGLAPVLDRLEADIGFDWLAGAP